MRRHALSRFASPSTHSALSYNPPCHPDTTLHRLHRASIALPPLSRHDAPHVLRGASQCLDELALLQARPRWNGHSLPSHSHTTPRESPLTRALTGSNTSGPSSWASVTGGRWEGRRVGAPQLIAHAGPGGNGVARGKGTDQGENLWWIGGDGGGGGWGSAPSVGRAPPESPHRRHA